LLKLFQTLPLLTYFFFYVVAVVLFAYVVAIAAVAVVKASSTSRVSRPYHDDVCLLVCLPQLCLSLPLSSLPRLAFFSLYLLATISFHFAGQQQRQRQQQQQQ